MVWPWVLVVAVVGGGGALLLKDRFQADGTNDSAAVAPAQPQQAGPLSTGPEAPAADPAPAPPVIQHPVDTSAEAEVALPTLSDSDSPVWDAVAGLVPDSRIFDVLLRDHLLQRWVTYIDNLDKPSLAPVAMAARPLPGTLQIDSLPAGEFIAAGNATRYAPYVAAFNALDAAAVGRLYARFYPLVQQAYTELGRKDAYFNDRLVGVIDHLLATPEPSRPLQVERDERGRYRFVDESLQSRSVGQKLLLRLDASQATAVKRQLRAIRAEISKR